MACSVLPKSAAGQDVNKSTALFEEAFKSGEMLLCLYQSTIHSDLKD